MKKSVFRRRTKHILWLGGTTYKCTHCGRISEVITAGMSITGGIKAIVAYGKRHMNCEPKKGDSDGLGPCDEG